ncbi:uncharacterized protein CLUP02_12933, partial [Colletotrichum lupini]
AGVDIPDPSIRTGPAVHGTYNIAQPNSAPLEGTSLLLRRAYVSHDSHSVERAALGNIRSDEDRKNLCEL